MATTYQDVAGTRCGCVCDDLCITVDDGRIVDAVRACGLAERWFLDQGKDEPPVASIGGRPADFDQAANHAANILANSRSPLIYGLSRSSTDGQRAAVRLADRIGATIDTTASRCHAPSIMAVQQVGESTCTLGEAKNRCNLVVILGLRPSQLASKARRALFRLPNWAVLAPRTRGSLRDRHRCPPHGLGTACRLVHSAQKGQRL